MRIPIVLASGLFAVSAAFASPYFSEVDPNTADDANLEYFDVRNPACSTADLSWWYVADASGKRFDFPVATSVAPASSIRTYRPQSKIALNNENETLSLFDPLGVRIDFYSYATSTKGVALVRSGFSDDVCRADPVSADVSPEISEPVSVTPEPVSISSDSSVVPSEPLGETPTSPEVPQDAEVPVYDGPSEVSGAVPEIGSEPSVPASSDTGSGETVTGPEAPTSLDESVPAVLPAASQEPVPNFPPSVSVSRAVAESLRLVDENSDGRFDFADVRYSENLSGTADPSEYFLYSNTGGLYAERVATATGYFSTASVSWSVLRLWFSGTTLQKSAFRTDASTASEFRIKSVSASSLLTASSWLPTVPLTLTTSFSGYSTDRVSYFPGFRESEPAGLSQSTAPSFPTSQTSAFAIPVTSVTKTGALSPTAVSKTAKTSKTASVKSQKSESGTGSPAYSRETVPPPEGLSVVPSLGVDLLPSGKYRYVCFSTSCPVSFKAEGIPSKSRSYWLFSDGRKRFWTSTSVIGKSVPATYRLAFVVESAEWTSKTPVDVSVVADPASKTGSSATKTASGQKVSASAKKTTKSLASSSSSPSSKKASEKSVSKSSAAKSSTWKTASGETGYAPEKPAPVPIRAVSAALASVFVGLSAWAGWFAYRRRAWLPEETP